MWQVTRDRWHMACDMWHMKSDMRWTLFTNFRSLALMVWGLWCFEYLKEKDDWPIIELINDWGICITTKATPGLLNNYQNLCLTYILGSGQKSSLRRWRIPDHQETISLQISLSTMASDLLSVIMRRITRTSITGSGIHNRWLEDGGGETLRRDLKHSTLYIFVYFIVASLNNDMGCTILS